MALSEVFQQARLALVNRAGAYQRRLGDAKNRDNWAILVDLARFCRAHTSTAVLDRNGKFDPLASARMDGRREVWLRFQHHLKLDNDTLWQLYSGQPVNPKPSEDE